MKAVLAGVVAAVVIAFIGAQVLELKVQQQADQRFSGQGVRL